MKTADEIKYVSYDFVYTYYYYFVRMFNKITRSTYLYFQKTTNTIIEFKGGQDVFSGQVTTNCVSLYDKIFHP